MAKHGRPGRPRLGRLVRRGLWVSFRVRAAEVAVIQLRAEEAGVSVSELARQSLLAPTERQRALEAASVAVGRLVDVRG